jgi:8-hydroxy-5-deazaflavin:NADPH oxidoreductase
MKIAILGTGEVGQAIAEKLASAGHEVQIGTRNVKETLDRKEPDNFGRPPFSEWNAQHSNIKLSTYSEAAAFGELIVNATRGAGSLPALELAGVKNLANKIILDISNPLDFSKGMPPTLLVCNTDSLAEQIQRAYPETKVVKSLNTLASNLMLNPGLLKEDHNIFLSGNDANAKKTVRELLNSFGWKNENIIDLGDITTARGTEQFLALWIRLWGALKTSMFNFKIVKS